MDARGPKDNLALTLFACWSAGVRAAHPATGVRGALDEVGPPSRAPWIIAVGKAAAPMAEAAMAWLAGRGRVVAGGVAVVPAPTELQGLEVVVGEHPVPGLGSVAAANAVWRCAERIPQGDPCWVLLSGGASSLMAAPREGLSLEDLQAAFVALLGSGLDITAMNRMRKRLITLGGGGLLRALGHRPIVQLVVSDVLDDDLAIIGSGPLAGDDTPFSPGYVAAALPPSVQAHLAATAAHAVMRFDEAARYAVTTRIVSSNSVAVRAAAVEATRRGCQVNLWPTPLRGEAASAGRTLVEALLAHPPTDVPLLLIAGGEATVSLSDGNTGVGGRCQELALAAAEAMHGATLPVALLAAGTDGRDGPTVAAGAIVSPETWDAIAAAGINPTDALKRHDSHAALAAAGAVVSTGPTGTNVADMVLLIRDADRAPASSGGPAAR